MIENRKNISIITNFGCQADCWYCIWKKHPLRDVKLDTNWDKLEKFLIKYRNNGKVSVSGGGDCLYKFDIYKPWWEKLFSLTKSYNMKIDVHTREKFYNKDFWEKHINKCVFSSDNMQEDCDYLEYLSKLVKLRITHLITEYTTFDMIEEYLFFQKKYNCQFTIKEIVGYDDKDMYEKIRQKYPYIYYLDKGDYNIYYMPNNTITDTFL